MIKDLLPAYYVAHGSDPQYSSLRSIVIDSHEVAWMEFKGKTEDGKPYDGCSLYCECNFKEGVGWQKEDDKVCSLDGPRNCLFRKTAVHLRRLELQQEYLKRFGGDTFFLIQHIPEIVADLIQKAKAGEFLEDGNGAAFWGGYFYLQTLAEIVDLPMSEIWKEAGRLVKNKKINLEGAVVQDYQDPPLSEWDEVLEGEFDDWVGIASLPRHRTMPREWKLEVKNPAGKLVRTKKLSLIHDPVFGPDVSDVARAKAKLLELIRSAKRNKRK